MGNVEGIIRNGLLPRSQLCFFDDVANHEIIQKRAEFDLESYVPFHFYCGSPFAGDVQKTHINKEFVYICLLRETAKVNDFQIIIKHPVTLDEVILYNYDDGIKKIDWDTMNSRNYHDDYCKHVCMAECLSVDPVMPRLFQSIKVKTQQPKRYIEALCRQILGCIPFYIDVEPERFI